VTFDPGLSPSGEAQLLRAPVALAVLHLVERSAMPLERALDAPVALQLAAAALRAVAAPAAQTRTVPALRARTDELAPLAARVAAHPGARWWRAPLRRDRQRWFGSQAQLPAGRDAAGARLGRLAEAPPGATTRVLTSTDAGGVTSLEVAVLSGLTTRRVLEICLRVEADDRARVREVDTAEDWHALCLAYPHPAVTHGMAAGTADLAPDWRAIADDWDAVHLTLHGLLTATDVSIVSDAGVSRLHGARYEQTRWLRAAFDVPGPATAATLEQLDPEVPDGAELPGLDAPAGPPPAGPVGGRWRRWRPRRALSRDPGEEPG
jgi:hypothetical protein